MTSPAQDVEAVAKRVIRDADGPDVPAALAKHMRAMAVQCDAIASAAETVARQRAAQGDLLTPSPPERPTP
ncbi:hypothetical protein [Litorimonas sp. WD9-15]|uniref:hypothetical protein n=1 Tax=Litorimonas sp. WD9-15 TaxID=3418716 RepID=UPI003D04382C